MDMTTEVQVRDLAATIAQQAEAIARGEHTGPMSVQAQWLLVNAQTLREWMPNDVAGNVWLANRGGRPHGCAGSWNVIGRNTRGHHIMTCDAGHYAVDVHDDTEHTCTRECNSILLRADRLVWRNVFRFSGAVTGPEHEGHTVERMRYLTPEECEEHAYTVTSAGPMSEVRCTVDNETFSAFPEELSPEH